MTTSTALTRNRFAACGLLLLPLAGLAQPSGWNDPFPPHRIMDNVYYVGTAMSFLSDCDIGRPHSGQQQLRIVYPRYPSVPVLEHHARGGRPNPDGYLAHVAELEKIFEETLARQLAGAARSR